MKNSLNSTVGKTANPFEHLWDQYAQGTITLQDLQQKTRSWMLNRVSSYAHQEMPPPPSFPKRSKKNMEGWALACRQRSLENLVNRLQLSVLLRDLESGRLVAEPGKKEQIQILLGEYPHHPPRR
ncbi:hypothetical protein ES702_03089 [subsurface metagenome]